MHSCQQHHTLSFLWDVADQLHSIGEESHRAVHFMAVGKENRWDIRLQISTRDIRVPRNARSWAKSSVARKTDVKKLVSGDIPSTTMQRSCELKNDALVLTSQQEISRLRTGRHLYLYPTLTGVWFLGHIHCERLRVGKICWSSMQTKSETAKDCLQRLINISQMSLNGASLSLWRRCVLVVLSSKRINFVMVSKPSLPMVAMYRAIPRSSLHRSRRKIPSCFITPIISLIPRFQEVRHWSHPTTAYYRRMTRLWHSSC